MAGDSSRPTNRALNWVWDVNLLAWAMEIQGGGFAEGGSTLPTKVYDYDVGNNLIYSGRAARGSSKANPVWQITKYSYSGTNLTDVQYANGSDGFTQIWNDRAALSYS